MTTPNLLIVDDEPAVREMLSFALQQAGYQTLEAASVREADAHLAHRYPDLILLDWMLPEVSGPEYVRRLKKDANTQDIPIIMLTARAEEEDKIRGLDLGVDDYITKPFSPRELLARVKAVLRRSGTDGDQVLEGGQLRLDPRSHRVTGAGAEIALGPTEYRLLYFFMTHAERVYNRAQLLDRVWGGDVYVEERTVDVHIRRLRKALAMHQCDVYIQTVRGTGYRFSTHL
ncbi:MAG: phosphate regulon transcriptional regulator PhoB [Pseudomonadota bacterium]